MSRSNNQELEKPAKLYFEWDGTNGGFKHFDKSKADESKGIKGKKVAVPLPFRFLVLDTLSTMKGFCDSDQSGFWSNEIRNIKEEELVVRTKNGIAAKGLYDKIISLPDLTGAKYCQSVYIGYMLNGKMEICNIAIVGAALGAWIDFRKKNKVFSGAITVNEMLDAKKGATQYKIPVFKRIETKPETDEQAKQLDKILQVYLEAYLKTKKVEKEEVEVATTTKSEVVETIDGHNPPFEFEPHRNSNDAPNIDDLPF